MKTILFSGVHGVGKGFFLDKVKENIQHYDVYSASKLIERYRPSTDAGYKRVSNVNNNQDILIKAIKEEKFHNRKDFIIDGHLCIFNARGDVEFVPQYFFIDAQITGIVLLQDEPRIICDRISQRDSNKISMRNIEKIQDEEQKYARELQNKFQIEYVIISHECTGEQFEEILRNIGGDLVE
ncbi:MAG: AAA family ATPase [Lachnospiraceae bacterium]|nr:AAA family ATPase [Lachnospiraceae bacterium]